MCHLTLLHSTMALLDTILYYTLFSILYSITLYIGYTWFYFTTNYTLIPLYIFYHDYIFDSTTRTLQWLYLTLLYYTLQWFYLILFYSATFYHCSTCPWPYYTNKMALRFLDSTLLYYTLLWLYFTLLNLIGSRCFYFTAFLPWLYTCIYLILLHSNGSILNSIH